MNLKIKIASLMVILILTLSACSAGLGGLGGLTGSAAASGTLESNLGAGLLALEGSAQAVTAAQAVNLLPLWQAYQSLCQSGRASASEIAALQRQIQEALTGEQLAAMSEMDFSQEALTALKQTYQVGALRMARSTTTGGSSTSSTQSSSGQPPAGVDMGMGGAPSEASGASAEMGAAMGGDVSELMGAAITTQTTAGTTSAAAAQVSGYNAAADSNAVFAGAVLQILNQRIQQG